MTNNADKTTIKEWIEDNRVPLTMAATIVASVGAYLAMRHCLKGSNTIGNRAGSAIGQIIDARPNLTKMFDNPDGVYLTGIANKEGAGFLMLLSEKNRDQVIDLIRKGGIPTELHDVITALYESL